MKKYFYKKTVSNWKNKSICVKCKEELSQHERYHSMGRCPHCGYRGQSAVTIVNAEEVGYRIVLETWFSFTFPFFHIKKTSIY